MNLLDFNTNHNKVIFFNACFDKNQVKNLVSWFLTNYGERKTIKFLEQLKLNGFHQATVAGISLGIEDLQIPPEKPTLITQSQLENKQIEQLNNQGLLTSVEKSQSLIEIWNQTSDKLRQTAIQNFKLKNPINPVYMMAFSGARGNVSQVRQLIAMRGLMADPQGAILEFPIQSNFREGLTITEYLISCYGARKGLVDTALRTATSGYLTRRLVDSAQHAVVSITNCQTDQYRILTGANLKSRLIGRVLAKKLIIQDKIFEKNHIISAQDAHTICKEYSEIPVRSPLTCSARTSICQCCYGWSLASGKVVQIGEAVGVIAAQSIGEPGTQLTMRTFHTGGVGVFSDQALKPLFAPYGGKINFLEILPGHYVRTPNGKIAFMLKYIPSNVNKILLEIKSSTNKTFSLTESQLPPGSILFVKQGEVISSKGLIGQASYIKVTKQQLPESSHPVYATQTGQIFYESMNLIIEKQKIASTDLQVPKSFAQIYQNSSDSLGLSETRRMSQIGSFWILKNSPKQEIQTNLSMVRPGDLISNHTTIGIYEFLSPFTQCLQLINDSITFGLYICELPISSIIQKQNYLIFTSSIKQLGLIVQARSSNNTSDLIWYFNHFKFSHKFKEFTYTNSILNKVWSAIFGKNYIPQGHYYKLARRTNKFRTSQNKKIFINKKTFLQYTTGSNKSIICSKKQNIVRNSKNTIFDNKNESWPILINQNLLKKPQLIPNNLEFTNFLIPKYYSALLPFSSCIFDDYPILNIKTWYQKKHLLLDSQFRLSYSKQTPNFYKVSTRLKTNLVWYKANLPLAKSNKNVQTNLTVKSLKKCHEISSITLSEYKNLLSTFIFSHKFHVNSKQIKTGLKRFVYPQFNSVILNKNKVGYYSNSELMVARLQFCCNKNNLYPKLICNFKYLKKSFSRGLHMYNYYDSGLHQTKNLKFTTFNNNIIRANTLFSYGYIVSKYGGELNLVNSNNLISVLQNSDLIKIPVQSPNIQKKLGQMIRWGEPLEEAKASIFTGQFITKNRDNIILRLGTPILISARGVVHVEHNDLIQKNQLIVTLKSRRLQTEDIVQGIPKIEQLFEARESQSGEVLSDTVHLRLKSAFVRELELLTTEHWSTAVDKSFLEAQNFLVENIDNAYSNQGVKISEKHIEVIVRQMTSRVRILEPGETGLLPGELVLHTWIKKFNRKISQIGLREATYEPIVLGISKSVLQSDSFLLAASFQEVSRVLIKSALSKKCDFLQGLHENVIVGQAIPAGTGLISNKLLFF
nr:DNA-directed RNA polymerase subunit beta' [Picochlorum sp. BH-2019]